MMTHSTRLTACAVLCTALLATACSESFQPGSNNNGTTPPIDRTERSPLKPFDSEEEFSAYMSALANEAQEREAQYDDESANNVAEDSGEAAAPPGNEEITNNQEAGVDEGGIVKNIGDYLVVLRRGRLYAVEVGDDALPTQVDDLRVAPDDALNDNVWYDEMLVTGDQIYVIGYRYSVEYSDPASSNGAKERTGATEVSSFSLDTATGELTRGETIFMESNDYFSSGNYASRMVDGELIFYMPSSALQWRDGTYRAHIPSLLANRGAGDVERIGPMFEWRDVTRPMVAPRSPVFHTVVRCALPSSLDMKCSSETILGEWSRTFYVSPEDIYIWSADVVYAMPLASTGRIAAHATEGWPIDQFSFKALDGTLYVAVSEHGEREDDSYGATLKMLALDRADFDNTGTQALDASNTTLLWEGEDLNTWGVRQRHIGDHYVMHIEEYGQRDTTDSLLVHHRVHDTTEFLPLGGYVSRIESLGSLGAMVAEQRGSDLVLYTLSLGATPTVEHEMVLQGLAEGESRSHGFFFKPAAQGGRFGLPVLGNSGGQHWWGSGVSNIAFFDVDAIGTMSMTGTVSSSPNAEGMCETSCVDWYGNTRPIFLGDRVFALMGSEIVEIDFDGVGGLSEHARILLTITN